MVTDDDGQLFCTITDISFRIRLSTSAALTSINNFVVCKRKQCISGNNEPRRYHKY